MKKNNNQSSNQLYLLIVAFVLAGAHIPLSISANTGDAMAMADLVKALNNLPDDWKPGLDPCSPKWSGVSCFGDRVTGINLRGRGIAGTLPSSLSSLSALESLSMSENALSGPLPSLGISTLEVISLDSNLFSSVPSNFFSGLSSLQKLSINDNPLSSWQLPDYLADCPLVTLSASNASVSGHLPEFFGRLSSLQSLRLSYNNLSGLLPASLSLSQIREFIINNQQGPKISGRIDVISQMGQLTKLWLQSNAFTGPIPDLSNLTSLQSFNIRDNTITGIVPNSLTDISSLLNVSLSNNNLQGSIPKFSYGVSTDIEKGNNFCLPEPAACDSKVMQLLAIAAGFGYPAKLARSWTGNNPCDGRSDWLGVICDQQGNILVLNFANHQLEGFISPEIANISSLTKVILNNNSLTGIIPNSIITLHQLQLLDVSYNQLVGPIPRFAPTVTVVRAGNNFDSISSEGGNSDRSAQDSAPGSISSSSSNNPKGKSKSSAAFIAGMVMAVLFLAGCLVGLVFYLLDRKKKQQFRRVQMASSPEKPDLFKVGVMGGFNSNSISKNELCTQFSDGQTFHATLSRKNSENLISIQELCRATNNFSEDTILGSGGFGVVYRGVLGNGMFVAVKRCLHDVLSMKGMNEFKAEIGLIGKARHKHLVALLGYCEHEKERLLVYEYMAEGTLAQHLFDMEGDRFCPLNWKQRLTIALDVAKGMEYLHNFMQGSFIHRDLKPSNILLDKDLRGKVSDFGLLKLAEDNEKSLATRLAGTFGYLAPEYAITGKITRKIDIYAFGVILLELLTSRKVLDNDANLVSTFRKIYPTDLASLHRFIDSSLFQDEESRNNIPNIAEIAYHCTAREPNYRPEMGNVVAMLSPIADRWSPVNNGSNVEDSEVNINPTNMAQEWLMSDDSSSTGSFIVCKASTNDCR